MLHLFLVVISYAVFLKFFFGLTGKRVAFEDVEGRGDVGGGVHRRHFGELDGEVAHVQLVVDVGDEGGRNVSA